jgi:hydrogenase expression/formation protein HypD
MEVCGTHTVNLRKEGIHSLLPDNIRLISGPGCPVCVTPSTYIDNGISLIEEQGAVVATFGDMLKVPGTRGRSLQEFLGGGRVRMVYSPSELPEIGRECDGPVVFLGIGFETTVPAVASVFKRLFDEGTGTLSLYPAFKTVAPALQALLADPEHRIDGFLLPGHVSVIIGKDAYGFLNGRIPAVITGFDALDMLDGIRMLLSQIRDGRKTVENAYPRAVSERGNVKAQQLIGEMLKPADSLWRGLGMIAKSGLSFRAPYDRLDAAAIFDLPPLENSDPPGCLCGRVIQGKALPIDCGLFGTDCTPEQPVGPCMVSSEGTCAAYLRFGERV